MTQNLPQVQSNNALAPKTFGELEQFARIVSESQFCPKDFRGRIADIIVAVQMGDEIGLKPIQSIQNISVINGRPSVWGDAMVALVRSSGLCEYLHESYDEQTKTATCTGKRKGDPEEQSQSFSIEDAKTAGLTTKVNRSGAPTIWKLYPKRMLQCRARGFLLRDLWADVIKGLISREEAMDYPETRSLPLKPEVKKINPDDYQEPIYTEPAPVQTEKKADWEMTEKQSLLIDKLIASHVFSEDEREKTGLFLSLKQTKISGQKMIDRLLNLIKTRKADEKEIRKTNQDPNKLGEKLLPDLIAGLEKCKSTHELIEFIDHRKEDILLLDDLKFEKAKKQKMKCLKETEDIPFGGVRQDERTQIEKMQEHENKLADLIAGLDSCARPIDVEEYIEQITGILLLLPEKMQAEFDFEQGNRIKKLL